MFKKFRKQTFRYFDGKEVTIYDYPPYNDTLVVDLTGIPKEAVLEVKAEYAPEIEITPGDIKTLYL